MAEKQGELPATVYDLQDDHTDMVKSLPRQSTRRATTVGVLVGAAVLAVVHFTLSTLTHGSYSWLGSSRCTHSQFGGVEDPLVLKKLEVETVFL